MYLSHIYLTFFVGKKPFTFVLTLKKGWIINRDRLFAMLPCCLNECVLLNSF